VGDRLGSHERHVPPVGELRGDPQRPLLATASHPDGQLRLDGLRVAARLGELHVSAREVGDVVAEQAADRLDRLLEQVEALAG
jgi:hypothetical protein